MIFLAVTLIYFNFDKTEKKRNLNLKKMQALQKAIADCFSATKPGADFRAILQVYVNGDSWLSNEECIIGLQEDLAVELTFCDEVIRCAATPFCVEGTAFF